MFESNTYSELVITPAPTTELTREDSDLEDVVLSTSPTWGDFQYVNDDKSSNFRLSIREKISQMTTEEMLTLFVTSEDLVTKELDKRFEEFGHHTLSEEKCCGKTYTVVDYYNEEVPIELQITHRNTIKPTIVADICCPQIAKSLYNFLITYMLYFFVTLIVLTIITSFLEFTYQSLYILNTCLLFLLFLLIAPILHVELMREVMKRFDCFYFLFWVSVYNFADAVYVLNIHGYPMGVVVAKKILMTFVYSLITFIDAIPDVYAGVRAKASIITILALYCTYWSIIMMFSSSYWEEEEVTFHFQKEWLISDIYISAWLSITVMLVKHTLHAVFFPHKYVIIAYGLDRKFTGKALKDMIKHIGMVQESQQNSFDHEGGSALSSNSGCE